MDSFFRVGIIGCGLIGNKRAKVIKDDRSSSLSCCSDPVLSNAESLIKQFGDRQTKLYQDWRAMLDREKLDLVVVATPNKYLKEITLEAAHRKIHILCEKPLGRNLVDSIEMVDAAARNKVFLKTGFNHRYHPAIRKAYTMVKEGAIGEIYYAKCTYGHGGRPGYEKEWRASKEMCGGGELLDQGVHVVDLFRWVMGDFEEAFGTISIYYWNMEVEDNVFALFKTAEGKTASMHTSLTQWKNRFTFEVYGEAGYLIVEGLGGSYGTETLKIGKRRRVKTERVIDEGITDIERPSAIGHEQNVQYWGGAPDEEVIEFPGPDISWEEEWKEFTAAIREGREPLGSGRDGLEANRMIEAAYRSARENRPIKIKEIKC
ncbi:MAG: Gfo/Idh/MocA family oxidoreductase [Syntrophaceae bacterium]|nr:Gfo/Idh/MocA family oxidoreductase [Syntrophaceae bacterium]